MVLENLGLPSDSFPAFNCLFVSITNPIGAFPRVLPFCPVEHLVPQHMVYFVEYLFTNLILVIIAPTHNFWVDCSYYVINGCGFHPFYCCCEFLVVSLYAASTGFYDGLI